MGLNLDFSDGQTPLDEEDKEGLLIPTISTRGELDEFEQHNIEDALQWALGKSFSMDTVLSEKFILNLHKRMYGNVWEWAGKFRRSNKNLGVDKSQIPMSLRDLCNDTKYWIENGTFTPDEIAIRFKHRLVSIHCFPNGNGRHSRLMADLIITKIFSSMHFSWGAGDLVHKGNTRDAYLHAIRQADKNDYAPLIAFARS